MTKEEYFERLNGNGTGTFPSNSQELEWFDEWLIQTKKGRKLSKESDLALARMDKNAMAELILLRSFFKNHYDEGITDFKVRYPDDKTVEFTPIPVRPYKNLYNSYLFKL